MIQIEAVETVRSAKLQPVTHSRLLAGLVGLLLFVSSYCFQANISLCGSHNSRQRLQNAFSRQAWPGVIPVNTG